MLSKGYETLWFLLLFLNWLAIILTEASNTIPLSTQSLCEFIFLKTWNEIRNLLNSKILSISIQVWNRKLYLNQWMYLHLVFLTSYNPDASVNQQIMFVVAEKHKIYEHKIHIQPRTIYPNSWHLLVSNDNQYGRSVARVVTTHFYVESQG